MSSQDNKALLQVASCLCTEKNIPTLSMKNATLHVLASSLKLHQDKTF